VIFVPGEVRENFTYLYDGSNVVQELSGTTVTANLINGGIDEVFMRTDSNGAVNFLRDALGSTLALTNSSGSTLAQYAYEPFGNTFVTSGSSANSYEYTGRENDGTGLYFYRARYYDPQLGRFISEDPVEFRGGDANLYGYVWNSPLSFIDSFGRWGAGLQVSASGGAGLGAGAVGSVAGGIGVFGGNGNGLSGGAYGTAGGFAGGGPYGPRYPNPPGSPNGYTGAAGYGFDGGAGVFGTNAKSVCDLKGPFKTLTIGAGLGFGAQIQVAWSNGTYIASGSVTWSPLPWPSGMASFMDTNTAVKPLGGRKGRCN
jgi:RHS repeat-associated protein